MATIGRKHAVAQFGKLAVTGFPAWLLWSVAHIYFLIGFRNRIVVAMNWGWNFLTFQRGTRLITGPDPDAPAAPPETAPMLEPA
jgi:NADH:quinone reductase (non-electrogenic)